MPYPDAVDGVNAMIWLIAREQVQLGHQVTLIVSDPPAESVAKLAETSGIQLAYVPGNTWRYRPEALDELFCSDTPDIVHVHSAFLPKQATLARTLIQRDIPYVVTTHAMHPQLLQRGRLKKLIYSWLMEKPRLRAAAAITVVTPAEERAVRAFVPGYKGIVCWIPNPVDIQLLECWQWRGNVAAKQLVYLGRFDVLHKGIDILLATARQLSNSELNLYGDGDGKTRKWLKTVQQDLPPTIQFHNPVYGTEKVEVLANASFYIQMSRWEVFGLSIAEAMYLGVPCAIAETLNMAELFRAYDLGLVLPVNPVEAANHLQNAFADPAKMEAWSERAKDFARKHFHPQAVTAQYLNLYEKVLSL